MREKWRIATHSLFAGLPDDLAVQEVGGFRRLKIVVEVEVACVCGLIGLAQVQFAWRRLPLCRENEAVS